MNEREFVGKKRDDWQRLEALVAKANTRRGLRALDRADLLALGPLYRRASSDLAHARANATSDDLVQHLNGLVGRAHALLYETETSTSKAQSVFNFYANEFPALLQKHARWFWASVALTFAALIVGYWIVIHHPARLDIFIPKELQSSAEAWKEGKVQHEASAEFAGDLMTHNYTVDLILFSGGITGGVMTGNMLFQMGGMLGAMAALMTQVHQHGSFWPGILPHGIAEFTAMWVCGAAGFVLAAGFLLPGQQHRRDSLRQAGLDAIKLVLGSLPLTIFAGVIEGMFSHLPLAPPIRYAFAAINGVLWYAYLFIPRGNLPPRTS